MTTTAYENTYVSVNNAKQNTADLPQLVELLRSATAPMSCKEIGFAMFGNAYAYNGDPDSHEAWLQRINRKRLTSHLSQMLRHLRKGGFVRTDEIDGEPIEVEREEYRRIDDEGNPQFIRVHDDEGNEYQMPNPKYDVWRACRTHGEWVKVKETITPKIKVYIWAAD